MGYILPVTHYNYKQYQNRMKETEESPHYISRPEKIVFHQLSPEYEKSTAAMSHFATEDRSVHPEGKHYDFYHISKLKKAQLTGKGGMINEQT